MAVTLSVRILRIRTSRIRCEAHVVCVYVVEPQVCGHRRPHVFPCRPLNIVKQNNYCCQLHLLKAIKILKPKERRWPEMCIG